MSFIKFIVSGRLFSASYTGASESYIRGGNLYAYVSLIEQLWCSFSRQVQQGIAFFSFLHLRLKTSVTAAALKLFFDAIFGPLFSLDEQPFFFIKRLSL